MPWWVIGTPLVRNFLDQHVFVVLALLAKTSTSFVSGCQSAVDLGSVCRVTSVRCFCDRRRGDHRVFEIVCNACCNNQVQMLRVHSLERCNTILDCHLGG